MSDQQPDKWWQPAVAFFARLSAWIAAPVIIGVFLGRWLDQRFNTAPALFLTSVGAMFILSMVGLLRETVKEFKKIDKDKKK